MKNRTTCNPNQHLTIVRNTEKIRRNGKQTNLLAVVVVVDQEIWEDAVLGSINTSIQMRID
jgi:hypothetical protein